MPDNNNNNSGPDELIYLIAGLIGVLVIVRLIQRLPQILQEQLGDTGVVGYISSFTTTGLYTILFTLALLFSVACLAGSVYAVIRSARIRKAQKRELKTLTHAAISGEDTENERWQEIRAYAASDDEELWRLAIIEADVMLDEMLEQAGYPQDELGEKLRNAERSDFHSIDQAWDAHKLRNVIAHEGSKYDLTKREVQSAIDNYREVFKEFGYI